MVLRCNFLFLFSFNFTNFYLMKSRIVSVWFHSWNFQRNDVLWITLSCEKRIFYALIAFRDYVKFTEQQIFRSREIGLTTDDWRLTNERREKKKIFFIFQITRDPHSLTPTRWLNECFEWISVLCKCDRCVCEHNENQHKTECATKTIKKK